MSDLDWLGMMASTSPDEAAARAPIMLLQEFRELQGTIGTMADHIGDIKEDIADIKGLVRDIDEAPDVAPEMSACTETNSASVSTR